MKNTCLYPFYEYIFKNWIQPNKEMPDFKNQSINEVLEESQHFTAQITQRKREIWDNTRTVLEQVREQKYDKLQECLSKTTHCNLCVYCQDCESKYWSEVKKLLCESEKAQKSIFLLPDEMKTLLEQKERPVDIYLDHYKRRNLSQKNCLIMLKGFSSSTPILLNYAKNTNFYSGGGFYIQWNGVGIAVDPGYLFVQNLQEYGLSVLDVDVVVITHEHIDHNSDMRLLDDLHYNAASNLKEKKIQWNSQKFSVGYEQEERHKIRWYMDEVTCREAVILAKHFSGFSKEYNQLYCVSIDESGRKQLEDEIGEFAEIVSDLDICINEEMIMHIFATAHEQYRNGNKREFFRHTFGCVFECFNEGDKRQIGYTSDTSLQRDCYQRMGELFQGCQVLIANISGIYEKDIMLQEAKERHLGYYGCYQIIRDLMEKDGFSLRFFLLSEFSNQVSDIRFDVSRHLQEEVSEFATRNGKSLPAILPTEIALTLDLEQLTIRCSSCHSYVDKVRILKPCGENEKLQYICSDCTYETG